MTGLANTTDPLAEVASQLESRIREGCGAIRAAWVLLAELLHEFHGRRAWEGLGYDSLGDWLGQPEIDLSRSRYMLLVRLYGELVVERGVAVERLALVEVTKAREVLPAIKAGRVGAEDALADAESLSRSDLSEKYRGDLGAGLDAEAEPARVRCESCGSWYVPAGRAG